MGYLDQSLSQDEHIVAHFSVHWLAWLPTLAWALAAAAAFAFAAILSPVALGILALIPAAKAVDEALKVVGLEQGVTNKRIVRKTGILGRRSQEMELASIETVELDQSALGRVLGYGTVRATGKGISDLAFVRVADPLDVKRRIESVSNPAA